MCERCRGLLIRDFDGWTCLLCGRSTTPPRELPAPMTLRARGRPRTIKLSEDQLAAIRTEAATVPRGDRGAFYRRLAGEHGMSAVYLQAIATGYKRA